MYTHTPLQHDVDERLADVTAFDGKSEELDTRHADGMLRRVTELIESPVTVRERILLLVGDGCTQTHKTRRRWCRVQATDHS